MVALPKPVACAAAIARLPVGQWRFAQQTLGEMQRQIALADALLPVHQQCMGQPAA
jgi:hypothetical protein